MASMSSHLITTFVFLFLADPVSCTTSDSPLNIETFYPTSLQSPPPSPPPLAAATSASPILNPPSPAPQPSTPTPTSSQSAVILATVVSSVATTLAVSALLFLCVQIRYQRRQQKQPVFDIKVPAEEQPRRVRIGREVLRYGKSKSTSKVFDIESAERLQELTLRPLDGRTLQHLQHLQLDGPVFKFSSASEARGVSSTGSTSPMMFWEKTSRDKSNKFSMSNRKCIERLKRQPPSPSSLMPLPLPPFMEAKRVADSKTDLTAAPPPPLPARPRSMRTRTRTVEKAASLAASTPPPSPPVPPTIPLTSVKGKEKMIPPPPPPAPPPPPSKAAAPPPPPPRPPPPPPRGGGPSSASVPLPPAAQPKLVRERKEVGMTLKPLHWDKVTPAPDHSMIWDNISHGSFRVNDELIASLFGNLPPKQTGKVEETRKHSSTTTSANPGILDPRRSQNIAIVLRSLSVRRRDILDAVKDGHGLSSDTLDKIRKIAPSDDERARLLAYTGDDSGLSDAESFLRLLIITVPSAFQRLDSMHFVSSFEPELSNVKGSLQSMELACKELKSNGLFVKLLEVVLKAGNRMNAGTARGDARAFNLSALKKLSDVKSVDGKTTLLHFVVHELVRTEGKKCALLNPELTSEMQGEERDQEYMKLGLPIIGGLSVQLGNVKKAASVDYDSLIASISTMAAGVEEVKRLLDEASDEEQIKDGFVREMRSFVQKSEEEVILIREEEERVIQCVKKTYEYYQPGVSKEKGSQPLQLFVTVNDFLGMVDKACVEIARVQQQKRKKVLATLTGRTSPETEKPTPVKIPVLPPSALLGSKFRSVPASSSDSEDEF